MTEEAATRGGLVKVLASRPVLLTAMVVGLTAGALLVLIDNPLGPASRTILAWDLACLVFIIGGLLEMRGADARSISAQAERQDEGGSAIMVLVLLAVLASLVAVGLELSLAKSARGLEKSLRVALAIGSVAVSWFMVQLAFALHYAHEFYRKDARGQPAGGLDFKGGEPPDYWDFLHFALIIGVANQTADIDFTSKPMRRRGTLHGILSFVFNTLILALTINLAASLF